MMKCKETAENSGGGSGNLNGGGTQNFNGDNQIDEGGHRGGQRPRSTNRLPAPQR